MQVIDVTFETGAVVINKQLVRGLITLFNSSKLPRAREVQARTPGRFPRLPT